MKHDWNHDTISLKRGRKRQIDFGENKTTKILQPTPLHGETCNMEKGLEEDEEEYLLQLFTIKLDKLLQDKEASTDGNTCEKPKQKQQEIDNIDKQAQPCGEEALKRLYKWLKTQKMKEMEIEAQVKQNQLQEINLGEEG